jgi:hypothetical protein
MKLMQIRNFSFSFIVTSIFFLLFITYWIFLTIQPELDEKYFNIFTDTYGVIALAGSVTGFIIMNRWGGFKSTLGKSIGLFSLGLLFQFLGQLTYAYYRIVLDIYNPWPSFAEFFYFGSLPIYLLALILLSKTMGVGKALKKPIYLFGGIILTFGFIFLDYFLFLKDYSYEDDYSKIAIALDYGYPIMQAILVSMAIFNFVLSKQIWNGQLKKPIIFLIVSLYLQYIADTLYTYRTYMETLYAGDYTDLIYILTYYTMSFSFIEFNNIYNKIKSKWGTK